MTKLELSNSKSICILAVVVCCIAILWPKVFLPMLQSALSVTSTQPIDQRNDISMLPPKVREAMKLSRPEEFKRLPGRPLMRDNKIPVNEIPAKTGGLTALVMPLYTVGIVVFFLYTILKLVFKNKSEELETNEDESPLIKDFQMDPEYRKFILSDEYDKHGQRIKKPEKHLNKRNTKIDENIRKSEKVVQSFGKDNDETQINCLKKRLEETEEAMERILRNISQMSGSFVANRLIPSPITCIDDQTIKTEQKSDFNDKINETVGKCDGISDEEDDDSDNEEYIESLDVCQQNESESDLDSDESENEEKDETNDLNVKSINENNIKKEIMKNINEIDLKLLLETLKSTEE